MTKLINIPEWANKTRFAELLAVSYKDFKEIVTFKAFSALNDGENYITGILRIDIEFKAKDNSLKCVKFILKIPLSSDNNVNSEYHDLFVTEADMYANVIPELEKIYAAAGQCIHFKPKHFKFTTQPNSDYILMEDLQHQGYKNVSRLEGLDEKHTKLVLVKLAQWHAASAKRVELLGNYSDVYMNSYITAENRDMIDGMNSAFEKPFIDCMESYNLLTEHKLKIRNYLKHLTDLYLKLGKVNANSFNVLNHGDFWMNNFMFRYNADDAQIAEILFVDFQMPKYGSSAQDLLCLLMTSPKMDIKLELFDDFIAYYHAKLLEYLQILNYQRALPTLEDLQDSLKQNGVWAFVCAQRMMAVALMDPCENSNIETFMSDNAEGVAFKKRMLYNPRYVKQIEMIIPWLIERNYLEIN